MGGKGTGGVTILIAAKNTYGCVEFLTQHKGVKYLPSLMPA